MVDGLGLGKLRTQRQYLTSCYVSAHNEAQEMLIMHNKFR
jgi:hypothetical protein